MSETGEIMRWTCPQLVRAQPRQRGGRGFVSTADRIFLVCQNTRILKKLCFSFICEIPIIYEMFELGGGGILKKGIGYYLHVPLY